ncbi:ABC transporter ATP-binding protein [Kitasatospora sp. NPDC096147]|uniref:ABC transporter ATP-binding protein n=1 Tax=Kitasatospora sp. NPDC096147 TaxID=3364093 RepID=UPI0037F90118
MTGEPILEVRGLCVDYGLGEQAVRAVTDATLTLHRGEVLGLAGESGSGKSTLAYALTRLLRAPGVITGGEVRFHGRDGSLDLLDADAAALRRVRWSRISVVFQSAMHALNPVARIDAQLTDALRAHRPELSAAQRTERAAELLRMVGISADRLRSHPHELSGGMRQRVMIAMALALDPEIVIMDEPTTALDVVTQREILTELMRLKDELGFAVVFITHDLSLLVELADTIAIMYAGRLVERGPARALFERPLHPYTAGLLDSFPPLHGARVRMEGIPGSPPALTALPPGCAFHPRCPSARERCRVDQPPTAAPAPAPAAATAAPAAADGERTAACWLIDADRETPARPARTPGSTP